VEEYDIAILEITGQGFADGNGLDRTPRNHLQCGHDYDRIGRVVD